MKSFMSIFVIGGIVSILPYCESSVDHKNVTGTTETVTSIPMAKQGKILQNFLTEEDGDFGEERSGNKSVKILTRPSSPQTSTTPSYPNYNPNRIYNSNPGPGYFPGGGNRYDSSMQASVQHPNTVHHQPPPPGAIYNNHQSSNNYPQQFGQPPPPQQVASQSSPSASQGVPDIYVQLIGAIEKLVGRMDKIDTRLRTVENILYHMTNKKDELPEQGTCPNDFRRVETIRGKCFKISSFTTSSANAMLYDWKSAENECTKVGGRLVEMLNYEDFVRVAQFLIKYNSASNSATSDYWIGGINPGLIWIWAESGQPVEMDKRFWNDNNNGSTVPGCLKLSYSHRLNTYFFRHSPCGHSQNYICEIMDNVVSRALARFEQQLWTEEDKNNNDEDNMMMMTLGKMEP